MSVLLDVDEIAAGDYSPEHGTVKSVRKTAKGNYVELVFFNGHTMSPQKGTDLEIQQGGRFDRPVSAG